MSMPVITPGISKCQAIADIIESVALMETALSHILNAEGEKLQAALGTLVPGHPPMATCTEDILSINKSVDSLISTVTLLETLLQKKLSIAIDSTCS